MFNLWRMGGDVVFEVLENLFTFVVPREPRRFLE